MSQDVEIIERETPYKGFFRIDRYKLRHRLHAGGWSEPMVREVFERGNAVGVLLYDPDQDRVVLIEQFRLPAHVAGHNAWQLEVVAGVMDGDDDESPGDVARREAREEAGVAILGPLVPIHRVMPSPGGSTEAIELFCGRVDARTAEGIHGLAEEHEDIKIVTFSYSEISKLLKQQKIENGPAIIALYWLAANRTRLRRMWNEPPSLV